MAPSSIEQKRPMPRSASVPLRGKPDRTTQGKPRAARLRRVPRRRGDAPDTVRRTAGRQDGRTAGRQDGRTAGRQDGEKREALARLYETEQRQGTRRACGHSNPPNRIASVVTPKGELAGQRAVVGIADDETVTDG